jgi:hypothetical protein
MDENITDSVVDLTECIKRECDKTTERTKKKKKTIADQPQIRDIADIVTSDLEYFQHVIMCNYLSAAKGADMLNQHRQAGGAESWGKAVQSDSLPRVPSSR